MKDIDTYRNIFNESYRRMRASRSRWFFDSLLASDADVRVDSEGLAGMIARTYSFAFHGRELPLLNISRATTLPGHRGKGLMSALMRRVLSEEAEKGTAFASLTPPARRLYFFFDRFGFATTVYISEVRFTAIHQFPSPHSVTGLEPDAALLRAIARGRDMSTILTDSDFCLLCSQIGLDGGHVIAAGESSDAGAILFASHPESGEGISVHALFDNSKDSAEAVLAALRTEIPVNLPVTVRCDAENSPRPRLRAGAMMRVVSAETVLSALAQAHPGLRVSVALRDPVIEANNALFSIREGICERRVARPGSRPDLDLSVDTLTRILFSEPHVGDIFGLPSRRPAPLILPG